jgi:hypothetical protein
MNQDGALKPKTSSDRGSGSPHERIHHSKHISKTNPTNLLATCAKSDKGGGVGLNHEVFAIYSTAALPPLWTNILHSPTPVVGDVSNTLERLHALAEKISASLPIYTTWTDIPLSSLNREHNTLEIHSLNTTTTQSPPSNHPSHNLIHRQKPHFLLNASLHAQHCIIGQHSKTETLLVVLRRPWCVLEICVSNDVHGDDDIETLEGIRGFARVAQEVDAAGYGTAVFLLGVEIDAKKRRKRQHRQMLGGDSRVSYGRVYELCNAAVFMPSLRSFNSFWIRLICVCAIELGVSFSWLIRMLCGQRQPPVLHDDQNTGRCKSDTAFAGVDIVQYDGRRHSTTELHSSSRHTAEKEGDIVQKMLDLYKHVLRRTTDYI